MNISDVASLIVLAISCGFAIFQGKDIIEEIFTRLFRKKQMVAGGLTEEMLETLQQRREAEEQNMKKKK
ncbi:hypothetical protein QTP88_017295 [Uroleucon formosanum]